MTIDPQFSGPTGPSFDLGDIYYILFRHKWRILICALIGIVLAYAYAKLFPVPFQSEAKLFVRYVITENKPLVGGAANDTKTIDQSGETIMSSEREILTSLDLAQQVAQNVGPAKILAKYGGGDNLVAAASVLQSNLFISAPPRSSVISLALRHQDPEVAQAGLKEFIAQYLKKHVEIHRAVGMVGDYLLHETDQLRARLTQTEEDLRKLMNQANIISLEGSKKTYADQTAHLRQQIFDAQTELAERNAVLQEMTKGTSFVAPNDSTTEVAPPPAEQVTSYQKIVQRLGMLQKREQDYLLNFTEESARVREVRAQISDAEHQKKKLETDFPALTKVPVAVSPSGSVQSAAAFNPMNEAAQIAALQSKIKMLTVQLEEVRGEAAKVDQLEVQIVELRRRKELEEENYRYYSVNLEKSRINETLSAGRVSNITTIQNPTPPFKAGSSKVMKYVVMLVMGGFGAGIGWAALIEFYLDRSIRRPVDVERNLRVPLFLSIPKLGRKEVQRLTNGALKELPPPSEDPALLTGSSKSPITTVDLLQPFHETLRDRLIGYFESKNLTHNPKLVAVTGLGRNSGVTTTAAGLARSLSETGDGNVLLVDMTAGQGSAQQFYQGKAVCGLDEILSTRSSAQIQDNLFVVAEEPGTDKLSRIMPQRFTKLIPKLKASDFDYIIFDMPPVSQISITPRLAGFMDMVLLVMESEKTDKDLVQRATALLAESKAHVGAVLNKTKTYVPPSLHQESLGNS